jgi:hypothetical protein
MKPELQSLARIKLIETRRQRDRLRAHNIAIERRAAEAPSMERLVGDLIQRGSEVSGRTPMTLTPYWRWIVYSYGPALLEALGTFLFLLPELVPMSVMIESRGETLGGNLGPEQTVPNLPLSAPVSPDSDSIPF